MLIIMIKKYFPILTIFFIMLSASMFSQENKAGNKTIDGLNFYPNPVSNGRIFVNSKLGLDKEVMIFDVLGKRVIQTTIATKELNVSSLSPGVYIIKIKEGEQRATRKLIIK